MSLRERVSELLRVGFARDLVEAMPDGVVIVTDGGELVYANARAAVMLGYHESLVGRSVDDLLPDSMRAHHGELRERYTARPMARPMGVGMLLEAQRRDGSRFPVEISLSPLTVEGETLVVAAIRDVTERLANEANLRRATEALHNAEKEVAVADDRERIARDLHDTVIQRLFGAGLTLQATLAGVDGHTKERLEGTIGELDATIRELRLAIFQLQNPRPVPEGLRGRISAIADASTDALGFSPIVVFEGPIDSVTEVTAEHVAAVAREGLANIARHASAKHAQLSFMVAESVIVEICDDGIGLPPHISGGRGIANLQARAREVGGDCEIASLDDGGTRVRWRAPLI